MQTHKQIICVPAAGRVVCAQHVHTDQVSSFTRPFYCTGLRSKYCLLLIINFILHTFYWLIKKEDKSIFGTE